MVLHLRSESRASLGLTTTLAAGRVGPGSPDSLEFNHSFAQEPSEWHGQYTSGLREEDQFGTRESKIA